MTVENEPDSCRLLTSAELRGMPTGPWRTEPCSCVCCQGQLLRVARSLLDELGNPTGYTEWVAHGFDPDKPELPAFLVSVLSNPAAAVISLRSDPVARWRDFKPPPLPFQAALAASVERVQAMSPEEVLALSQRAGTHRADGSLITDADDALDHFGVGAPGSPGRK